MRKIQYSHLVTWLPSRQAAPEDRGTDVKLPVVRADADADAKKTANAMSAQRQRETSISS
jgi:hypothetical protein